MAMNTPWGRADSQKTIADGLILVSTRSHGGYWLCDTRAEQLARMFPGFTPWTGSWNWLEEDCDWRFAAIAYPELFTPLEVYHAVRMQQGYNFRESRPENWFLTELFEGRVKASVVIARRFARDHAADWLYSGASGGSQPWSTVLLRRIGDGAKQSVRFASWPEKAIYTDGEIAEALYHEPAIA